MWAPVEADSPGLFQNAALYIGEVENRYLTGEVRRKVIYHLYKLPAGHDQQQKSAASGWGSHQH